MNQMEGNSGLSSQAFASICGSWRHLAFVFALAGAVWIVNGVWLARDTRPPVWDMAAHQMYALNYLPGGYGNPDLPLWRRSGNYPPFVHLVVAAIFWLIHPGPHAAILANIPATFLLFWAIFELARMLSGAGAARWTCILAALTPYLIWFSREVILDYWLCAWVAVSLVFLLKSDGFESRSASLLCGLACMFGLLTKWIFVAFLAIPVIYIILRHHVWRSLHKRVNCALAAWMAGIIPGLWYLCNAHEIFDFFIANSQVGAKEGEPPVLSFQSCIYYLRLLEGYQLFALLFGVVLLSCLFVYRSRGMREGKFWILSIVGGWLILTALRTKDARFTMPLLGPMLIVAGIWIESWGNGWKSRVARTILITLLCIQAYALNFGIRWLPQEVVIAKGYQSSVQLNWNLYLQHLFHVLDSPKQEDWKLDAILDRLIDDARSRKVSMDISVIPDLPRFNSLNLELYARFRRLHPRVEHRVSASKGTRSFDDINYVIIAEKEQGMNWTTQNSQALNRIVFSEPRMFHLMGAYPLPNGDTARLYSILRSAVSRRE
jgi:4-amino-4-deoxy-L-arabinose transferase-like glycosyltransferase